MTYWPSRFQGFQTEGEAVSCFAEISEVSSTVYAFFELEQSRNWSANIAGCVSAK